MNEQERFANEERSAQNGSPADFDLLMSLALDDLLADDEQSAFERDLADVPLLAEKWMLWQELDRTLHEEPDVLPPPDFAQKFGVKLAQKSRRRRLWFGMAVGSLSIFLWLTVLFGAVGAGVYLILNAPGLSGDLIQNAALALTMLSNLLDTAADLVGATLLTPQVWAVTAGYCALLAMTIIFWTRFLRRSVQLA